MNESEQNFCFEDRRLSLIDVSFEDDCLYSSPSHDFHVRFSDAAKTEAKSNLGFTDANLTQFDGGEVGAEPVESVEAERVKKKNKYNLRKSIAWDSAFFTSAGVLEPEELSTMIGSGKHMLPGIEEDIHKSTDSISTLASDNLTLENLEADLFGDIRASIQRSTKGSDVANSTSKVVSPETENASIPSLEKADVASQNKLKAKSAPNKPSAVMQGIEKTAKQSNPVNGDSKSLCRPPKIASRVGPILTPATKRASLGANRVKVEKYKDSPENEKRLTGKGVKVPALGGPRNVVPRPTLPIKASLRSSSALKTQLKTSSCVDSSGRLSSDSSSKSSLNFLRKDDSRTGNHSSSTSNVKTALKLPSRNKNQSTSSHLSPYLKSVTKLSSNISPASSISEWSSASLSPTSTLNKKSNSSRSSFDISSCKDASGDSDASQVMDSQNYFNDEHSVGHGTQVGLSGECVKKATTASSSVLHPDSAKPSGLRLPSPKIGFFDGVRSAVRTPNRNKQSHEALPSGLPGFGAGSASPNGGSNEAKVGKLQPARTAVRGTRIMDQVTASGMKSKSPLPLQESSIAAPRVSSAVKNEKRNASISLKAQNRMSLQGERKSNLKDKKVGLEECNKSLNNSDGGFTEKNGDACFLKDKKETECKGDAPEKDTEVTLCNGLPYITTDSSSIPKVENITSLEKVSGDVICSQNYIKDSLPYPYSTNEKEKASIEDRVDGLTKQIGAVDFYIEMHKETVGDSLSLSKDDVSRVDSGIQEEFNHSSKPTSSLNPTMASTIVEAEAGIEKDFVEGQVGDLTKQVGAVDFHLDMHKEGGGDSLSLSRHDVIRVDSGIQEECKELPNPACSPVPDIASSMVETEKAEAGLHKASSEDQVDGLTKQIGAFGIHVKIHKEAVGDSLSFSQDDVGRVHSHIGEQFKELSNPTSSPYPAIASTMVEAEKAEAGIEKVSVKDLVDSLTKQIGTLDIHVEVHKELVSDSLSHSQDDASKVDFGIQEEYNELSKPACSATPARASTTVEAQMAEAAILLHPTPTNGKPKDGETSQQ
ncbi:hypothetical protein NC652_036606 [Populus alba x Populus x berolinensis]|uniref:Uncharacterized protein n=1 Tax=Populus tomentosa TaxID=118781 RepID=A0A8X7YGX4_POPTO|nr:hypothetical protein POTOM_051717 [Populus tomentosa]KAJ6870989.1 hypothetical protein NC652_036606 [Populus alba x Populus x berolinensis]